MDRIEIKGYKSIKDLNLKLSPINIFIGANGSGKSNFLSFFEFLKNIYNGNLQEYVALRGLDKILHKGDKVTGKYLRIFILGKNGYSFSLKKGEDAFVFTKEGLWYEGLSSLPNPVEIATFGFESNLRSNLKPRADYIREYLNALEKYHFHDTGEKSPFNSESNIENDKFFLYSKGQNLAAYLFAIYNDNRLVYNFIVKTIQSIAPYFLDFIFKPEQSGNIRLRWQSRHSSTIYGTNDLSDGTLMQKANYRAIIFIPAIILIIAIKFSAQLEKRLVPTYPLIDLDNKELSVVQNSMHTFIYSLYRNNHSVLNKHYFPDTFCDSSLKIKKVFRADKNIPPKNVVLFIMESVPKDFFDSSGIFKVRMPFFDSLLHHSTFFSNAYSYGLESNKGITSILGGIPTLTDIPLYHSSFINLPKTSVGKALRARNYSSFFCIGDTYDNFGFAKCVYWLGFDKYYCDKDIPGYKKLPYGPMGIYDEYVLRFMHQKINLLNRPFLAVNYNTTTHFPHTLPSTFKELFPSHYTDDMKSMVYYDSSLHQFFNESKNESWFANTVFIFCSDHWMSPDDYVSPFNNLTDFRIPIIIYDPSVNEGEKDPRLASQFDILGTILGISGYSDTAITYGTDLLNSNKSKGGDGVYNRVSNSLYQVNDGHYILGFNVANDQTEYLYNYQVDKELKNNLVNNHRYSEIENNLEDKIKIFFQKSLMQYFDKPFE